MGRLQSNKSMLNGVNGNSTHGVCSAFFFTSACDVTEGRKQ